MKKKFRVTQQHITLLRNAYVHWSDNSRAPMLSSKTYGNGDVLRDICRLLGEEPAASLEEFHEEMLSKAQEERYLKLHRETEDALQIFLCTGEMREGLYECEEYGFKWTRIEEA